MDALVLAEFRGRRAVSAEGFDGAVIAGIEGSDTSVYRRDDMRMERQITAETGRVKNGPAHPYIGPRPVHLGVGRSLRAIGLPVKQDVTNQ